MNCSPRQLLSVSLVLAFACATLGADGSGAPRAVLQASGKVQVNGVGSRKTTTLFSGDSVQTDAHSVANIIAGGSSVFVNPSASVKFLGNAVEVDAGDVTITTSTGMAAKADALTIAPAPGGQKHAKFAVGENEDSVIVAALQGDVAVSDGQQTSTTPEGQETTHKKKRNGGGAPPAATRWISVRNVAIVAGSVIGAAILLDELDDYKRCISPPGTPGTKKCKCKIDKNGVQTCREET
jgi:ferric-dicitrate binding protein FerR (iron transport regulator)